MFKFLIWIGEQITTAVDQEYSSPEAIQRQLLRLSEQLEQGAISEKEYERAESELLDRLAQL